MSNSKVIGWTASLLALLTLTACSKAPEKAVSAVEPAKAAIAGHSHDDWWCSEHGVPEEVCAQCNPKLVADFKAKGDWCNAHNRPESQCFICHPEKEAEFAALYEAKYGTKPPKPAADVADRDHRDHG